MTFGKLLCGQKRLSSGNPSNEAVVMEVASDGAFSNLVVPRRHQGLQFFHCDPWGFCCFSHHFPQYPGGQDAVVSSTHEVFNSSISLELLYNCSDSAQWYIQSFSKFSCSHYHIYEGLRPSASFELPIILFSSWCWMTKGYCMCVTSFLYPSETEK